MASNLVDNALEKMGWTAGFGKLEAEVDRLVDSRSSCRDQSTVLKDRFEALQAHMRHVDQEYAGGQKLLSTQRAQLKAANEKKHLAQLELEGLRKSMLQITKQITDIKERRNLAQKDVDRVLAHIEVLKSE